LYSESLTKSYQKEARGEERWENELTSPQHPPTCLKRANFKISFNGIAVPVLCAAGEPKRGLLSCLLCPCTRALGTKRPKPDNFLFKKYLKFPACRPKKNPDFLKGYVL
jgi:hypothetical protein